MNENGIWWKDIFVGPTFNGATLNCSADEESTAPTGILVATQ